MTTSKSVFLIYLSPHTQLPAAPGSIPSIPEILLKNVEVTEESGQWLEYGYRTHLLLASGKLVLQKIIN